MKRKSKKTSNCCENCSNYVFDEEYQQYSCMVNLDEDEMYRFLTGSNHNCSHYRFDDEYAVVRKQN